MGNSVWWHGWHPLFHLKSDRRERTITGVEPTNSPMSFECMSEQKEICSWIDMMYFGHMWSFKCVVCLVVGRLVWLVGSVGITHFVKHDKWTCLHIVNAAPRHWWDVVSDVCQFMLLIPSHKCVPCVSCGFWFSVLLVVASKWWLLKTVPFLHPGPIKLYLTWINFIHVWNKVSKLRTLHSSFFELVL